MRKCKTLIVIISLFIVTLFGCGKEKNTNQKEVNNDTENISVTEIMPDLEVKSLNVALKVPNTWECDIDNGISAHFEGGILTIYSDPIENKMTMEELEKAISEEPNGITEKIFNQRQETIDNQSMHVFDFTGKANENNIYGTVYQFSTDYEYYIVQFAFLEGYDYGEVTSNIMDNFKIVPYSSDDLWRLWGNMYKNVQYEDVLEGTYDNEIVCLEGVIDNISQNNDGALFDIWYQTNEGYTLVEQNSIITNDIVNNEIIDSLQMGDVIKFIVQIDENSCIDTKHIKLLQKAGSKNLAEIKELQKPENEVEYTLVTYDDIKTGAYNGQFVLIEGIVDDVQCDEFLGDIEYDFNVWYKSNNTYVLDSNCMVTDDGSEELSDLKKMKTGDCVQFVAEVYEDGSFGITNTPKLKIINTELIENIYTEYKNNCNILDYKSVARNPDNYYDTELKVSGTVQQLINEDSWHTEFLLNVNGELVYISYNRDETFRESRILEGDTITAYGSFYFLASYETVIGTQNTIPEIHAKLIEIVGVN